jgi:hypothetical protein
VGFIAYVAGKLSEKGIGTNPVSGFFHDHVFVGVGREAEAMECLEGIAREGKVQLSICLFITAFRTSFAPVKMHNEVVWIFGQKKPITNGLKAQ